MTNAITNQVRSINKLQFNLNDLTGGYVAQAATYDIDERYLADINNMELVQGLWQKRKGYNFSGSFAGVGANKHTNTGFHVFSSQGNLHVLGAYGTKLYDTYQYYADGKGKLISSGLPVVDRYRFADFRNEVYIACGAGGLYKYSGSHLTKVPAPSGNVITVYDSRLILAGIIGDKMTLYYSEQGDGKAWDPLNYVVLDGGSNEKITAMVPVQGKLFIFTNQSIYSLMGGMGNFEVTKEVNGIGAASSESCHMFGNVMYFISDKGSIYEFDGGSFPVEISVNMSAFIQANFSYNDFKRVAITSYKHSIWFTLDNSTVPSERITLVYYPDYQAWTKFSGIPAAAYANVGNEMIFTGVHNEGSIYHYGTQWLDDMNAIDGSLKTVKWDFNALENLKRFKRMFVRGALQGGGGNGFDMDFYLDDTYVATVHVTSDIANPDQLWGAPNEWGTTYWGYAKTSSGSGWGHATWGDSSWNSSEVNYAPRWGSSTWNAFKWNDHVKGTLPGDVGKVYEKLNLSQYSLTSGKTLQIVLHDNTPNSGFRFEDLTLMYMLKHAR